MRTTVDVPDKLLKRAKEAALREGLTLKAWFVAHMSRDLDRQATTSPLDAAARFRARIDGAFEPTEIDRAKRSGRA